MAILTTTNQGLHFAGGTTFIQTGTSNVMSMKTDGKIGIGVTSPNAKLDVNGGISSRTGTNSAYSVGVLEISDGGTPTQVKITTAIPFSGTTNAHSIKISGFQYGSANTVDLQISWHVYNNSFYNRAITSSGGWAPTVTLAVENGYVVVHLLSPGYWPKMYVESLYNAFGSSAHAQGWSWSDAAISGDSGKPVQTVPYKANFGNSFLMDSDGNVGIGTTNPGNKLHIFKNASLGSPTSPTVANAGLQIQDSDNSMYFDGNSIVSVGAGNLEIGAATTSMLLITNGAERMRINSSGNVGIGTTSPQTKLHVEDGAAIFNVSDDWHQSSNKTHLLRGGKFNSSIDEESTAVKVFNGGVQDKVVGNYWGGIGFMHLDPENSSWGSTFQGDHFWIGGRLIDTPSQERSALIFAVNSGNTAGSHSSEKMVILPDGKVGIGVTDPQAKLDVDGGIVATGNSYLNQSNQYNNSTPGLTGFGNKAMDASISYYDTGKNLAAATRGIVWTGKHYIVTDYSSQTAKFYNSSFESINNTYGSSISLPNDGNTDHPHGAAWDGRYLYVIQYTGSGAKVVAYDLDNGTGTATIVFTQALQDTTSTYDVEYAEGHLYTAANGKVSQYKLEGKTITHVQTTADILDGLEAQAITYDGSYLWITQNGYNVYQVRLNCTLVGYFNTGVPPNNVGWAWNGQNIASVNYTSGDVYIINTASTRFDTEEFLVIGGNVGIGTTSPYAKLEVTGATPTGTTGYGDNANSGQLYITSNAGVGSQLGGRIAFGGIAGGGGGAFNGTRQDSVYGTIEGYKSNATANNAGGGLSFKTNFNNTGALTERMNIDQAGTVVIGGNVGIGTTDPGAKLEVMQDGGAIIRLHDPGNNSWKLKADTDFHVYDDSGSDYLTIVNSGNVGINTTDPGSRLVVAGGTDTAYNDGTLKVVGSIALNAANNLNPSLNRWALRPRAAGVEGSFDIYDARHSLSRLTIVNSGNVGIGTTTPSSKLEVYGSGGTVLDIQGSQGQLFSITDDLTGDLFTVSDISGMPIFNVNASGLSTFDGDISIAEKIVHSEDTNTYIQFPGTNDKIIFTTNGTDHLTLDATPNATFAGSVSIGGNLIGASNNTTELGTYTTGAIKRIRMAQGGELHFGDTTTAAPLGITEGNWNSFSDQDRLSIYGRSSIKFYAGSLTAVLAATLQSTGLTLNTITNATSDTDKFLVSDSGIIKYRTGAELLSDIGAVATSTLGSYLPLTAGSTKKLTDTLYIEGTNSTGAESVLVRGVSSNDGDWLGSIRTANTGGYNQEMRFYTSDADGTTNENLTLTLSHDKNATFVGTVTAPKGRFTSTGDASIGSTTHAFQAGTTSSTNIIIDNNEIMARNNGATSALNLNPDGNTVTFHSNGNSSQIADNGNATFAGDLTISGGDITLGGTGRIQGIDTVSAGTDATSKNYVDSKFTSTDASQDDYTFKIDDEGNLSGNRWYHVATTSNTSGGLHIRGFISNHVEAFASQKLDLAIQAREGNNGGQLEITGNVDVLHNDSTTNGTDKVGIRVIKTAENGTYDEFKVYVRTCRYSMVTLRLSIDGAFTFNTVHTSPATSEPAPVTGGQVEIDTSHRNFFQEGNHLITNSEAIASFASIADGSVLFNNEDKLVLMTGGDNGTNLEINDANGQYLFTQGDVQVDEGSIGISADGSNHVILSENGTGDFKIDAPGDMTLDAGGGDIILKDDNTEFGLLANTTNNFVVMSRQNNKDLIFKGIDNATAFTALTLDMSEAGKATFNNDVIAFSDRKLKKDIKTLDGSKVYDMRGVSYVRKDTGNPGAGVVAQEIQKVAPELVNETNGTLGVSYGNITGYLIEAIKDLKAEIEELKKQIK